MGKIDLAAVPVIRGSDYPPPFDAPCAGRASQRLARHAGLTQFGASLTVIDPDSWSSQRHWHSEQDEFVWVVEGELVLITQGGETILRAGDCAAFPKGEPDGHHLVNRGDRPATVLAIGGKSAGDRCIYADIDMIDAGGETGYTRRDGTPYRNPAAPG